MNESHSIVKSILELLKIKGKSDLLPEIIEELQKELELSQHEIVIESAVELGEEELDKFVDMLSQKLGYQPNIANRIDPDLIAGVRLKIGDQIIDVSLKDQIEKIKNTVH